MTDIEISIDKSIKLNSISSVFVSFKYDAEIVRRIKTLRLRFYDPTTRAWEIPSKDYSTLLEMFLGYPITIKQSKSSQVMKDFNEAQEKEKPKQTSLPVVSLPEGFDYVTTPFNHQREGVLYGLSNDCWILGDEQGLGKTKQVIDLAVARKLRGEISHCVIVCCVNGLKYNWANEVSTHSDESAYIVGTYYNKRGNLVDGSVKDRIDSLVLPRTEFFIIVNIESLRNPEFVKVLQKYSRNNMIAVDEFHKCCNPSAQQSKGLLKLTSTYKVAMTGTPILNQPIDLYTILKWLGFESSSFYQFKNHFCLFGGFGGYEITGYKNMQELRDKIEKVMLRRLKKDVLDLPKKMRQYEYVQMRGKQELLYNEVRAMLRDNLQDIILSPNPLAQLIRLRQVTGAPEIISNTISDSAKLDRMEEIVEDLTKSNEKVVIFSQWAEVIQAAKRRLSKYSAEVIDGTVPSEQRQAIVTRFQSDSSLSVLLGTTGSMGTGLTLTAATTAIFLDLPWTESAMAQAEDRLHRIGTKGTVSIICLTCKDTIDERIIDIVEKKKDIAEALIDGHLDKFNARELVSELLS